METGDIHTAEIFSSPWRGLFGTRFQERSKREVFLGRVAGAKEDAEFAAYLCSEPAGCFVGQVFPMCGGWVPR